MADGDCYLYGGSVGTINSNNPVAIYDNCTTCLASTPTPSPSPSPTPTPSPSPTPTPSPTPAPASNCNTVDLEFVSTVGSITCTNYQTFYMNTNDFCTATNLYRDSACTRGALSGVYNTGSFYREWNGSTFTLSCTSTICP